MKITVQETDRQILAKLVGEFDTAAAQEMEKAMQPLYACEGRDIVMDCSQLGYIASSGLRVLLGILKNAKSCGSKVVLKDVNDVIRDVLELTGFVSLFEFA